MTGRLNDFLAHFGVKGMRWGVRNDDSGRSSVSVEKKGSVVRISSTIKLGPNAAKNPTSVYTDPKINRMVNKVADDLDRRGRSEWPSNVPATASYSVEMSTKENLAYVRLFLKPYSEGPVTTAEKMSFNPAGKLKHTNLSVETMRFLDILKEVKDGTG